MKITISFRHLEHTPALDEKIRSKSEKLGRYLDGHADLHWSCYIKNGLHYADLDLKGASFACNASANADNLYKSFDLVLGKIEKQLQKQKEKWKNKLHTRNGHRINPKHQEQLENKKEERKHDDEYDEAI
jgi:putative sigma-54 modulation protein